MKSYHSLDECFTNIKKSQFIFKQNQLIKSYSIASLDEIKKFQSKHKCNIYEYVDYNKSIRVFFYIELNNNKEDFDFILNHTLKILNFSFSDLIIIQENDSLYRILHKFLYVPNITILDEYLFKKNLFNITLHKSEFISTILNDDIITSEKYDFKCSILSNIDGLDLFDTHIDLISVFKSSRYLEPIEFKDANTIFVKSDMGTGKSTATVNYIKDNNINSFLIFSCRRTLTYTIYDKLNQNNIDVDNYISSSQEKIKMSSKIIISPDSIHKIQYPLIKFDFIWIDEGVSFMYYLGNHLFVDTKFKSEIMIIIEWLLQNCKKLLITDADLNNHIIQFYLYFRNISYTNYFIYKKQSYNYKYEIIDLESDILESLKNHIISHQNLYICCDTLIKTKFIYDFIINLQIIDSNKILLYNSESNKLYDKKMYDVNSFWNQFQVVIVSPKVVFGVDFNIKHFDYVYGFYKCTTLTVRECFQQLHRIRTIKNQQLFIHIYESKKNDLIDNITNIKYNIQINKVDNIFYKKNSFNIDYILNSFILTITKNGYKYINMNHYINYLILYCIYETNHSLNNFKDLFYNIIK